MDGFLFCTCGYVLDTLCVRFDPFLYSSDAFWVQHVFDVFSMQHVLDTFLVGRYGDAPIEEVNIVEGDDSIQVRLPHRRIIVVVRWSIIGY